jgi:hypothetical protein
MGELKCGEGLDVLAKVKHWNRVLLDKDAWHGCNTAVE